MQNDRISRRFLWVGASLFFASLVFAEYQLKFKSFIFYPPELAVYLLLIIGLSFHQSRCLLARSVAGLPRELIAGLALILTGGIIGAIVSPIFPQSLGALKVWIILPVIFSWLVISFGEDDYLTPFEIPLIMYVVLLSVIGFVGIVSHGGRLVSIFDSANFFSALSAPILALSLYRFFEGKQRLFYGPAAIIVLVATILTQSLGAYLGLILVGVVLIFFLPRSYRLILGIAALLLIIGGSIVGLSRFSASQNSFKSRIEIWRVSVGILGQRPLQGTGLRGFDYYYTRSVPRYYADPIEWIVPQPHNLVLAWWTSVGLIGLAGFIVVLRQLVPWTSRPTAYHIALLVVLGHGLVDTPYWKTELILFFWFYLSCLYLSKRKESRENVLT